MQNNTTAIIITLLVCTNLVLLALYLYELNEPVKTRLVYEQVPVENKETFKETVVIQEECKFDHVSEVVKQLREADMAKDRLQKAIQ